MVMASATFTSMPAAAQSCSTEFRMMMSWGIGGCTSAYPTPST
jgi:hypothetical protein